MLFDDYTLTNISRGLSAERNNILTASGTNIRSLPFIFSQWSFSGDFVLFFIKAILREMGSLAGQQFFLYSSEIDEVLWKMFPLLQVQLFINGRTTTHNKKEKRFAY